MPFSEDAAKELVKIAPDVAENGTDAYLPSGHFLQLFLAHPTEFAKRDNSNAFASFLDSDLFSFQDRISRSFGAEAVSLDSRKFYSFSPEKSE